MSGKLEIEKYRPKLKMANLFSFATTHPGLLIFVVYATTAIAGFIYLITFYSYFALEVTIYLEITDILVAGIKDPMVMLMVLGAFSMALFVWIVAYVQAPLSAWLDNKFEKGFLRIIPLFVGVSGARSFWWMTFLVLAVYFYTFINIHSKNKAKLILDEKHDLVFIDAEATKGSTDEYSLLGTSMNYVFLYNHQAKRALVLPLESVNSIEPKTAVKELVETLPVDVELVN
ncbi:hypothetical protein [Glaciecola petra]|uniref:YcxB-like protein domain-containing protein n=1 Tax=Glaciecola petra TaxID=3075602 RepID=A0ABU2ZRE1_9ALTE|nr:hypothetical protein [Aestuariibacter sp. P117]MDT0594980.1 hypothetical protein [Aestuariibacter sp. P117]